MTDALRILIADDHPLILEGNKSYLESKGFNIIATASDGNDAYNKIVRLQPDIAILDMRMPVLTGIEVAQKCQQKKMPVKIILLSLHLSQELFNAVGITISGYLLKEDALDEIFKCIEKVARNEMFISSKVTKQTALPETPEILKTLSASELKIVHYIAQKMSTQEIADSLFLSPRTIDKHRENIIKKLGLPMGQTLSLWVAEYKSLFEF